MKLPTIVDDAVHFPHRFRAVRTMLGDSDLSRSYYPDAPRKSRARMWWDNLLWVLKRHEPNRSYFMYGLDRVDGPSGEEFLAAKEYFLLQLRVRDRMARQLRDIDYHAIIRDKFVFSQVVRACGFPSPEVLGLIDAQGVIWDAREPTAGRQPLETLTRRELDCFCKLVGGGQGTEVFPLRISDGQMTIDGQDGDVQDLRNRVTAPAMLQQRIEQHPEMARLNPHSVNTIRLITILPGGGAPEPFVAVIRMGTQQRPQDNWSIGGLAAAVDFDSETIRGQGVYKPGYGTRTSTHPDTGVTLDGFRIPHLRQAAEMCCKLHEVFYGFHSVGWDVAITPDGPTFLEANDTWLVTFMQALHGGFRRRFRDALPFDA